MATARCAGSGWANQVRSSKGSSGWGASSSAAATWAAHAGSSSRGSTTRSAAPSASRPSMHPSTMQAPKRREASVIGESRTRGSMWATARGPMAAMASMAASMRCSSASELRQGSPRSGARWVPIMHTSSKHSRVLSCTKASSLTAGRGSATKPGGVSAAGATARTGRAAASPRSASRRLSCFSRSAAKPCSISSNERGRAGASVASTTTGGGATGRRSAGTSTGRSRTKSSGTLRVLACRSGTGCGGRGTSSTSRSPAASSEVRAAWR
ncbi:MAG: hypothetical protein WKG00_10630 [Polyangiaceae bacterium]